MLWHRQNLNATSFAIALTLCGEIRGQTFVPRGVTNTEMQIEYKFRSEKNMQSHTAGTSVDILHP
jgi:hypothetical protein